MQIRHERDTDRQAVHAIHIAAFETDAEAKLVDSLRARATPIVSMVADANPAVLGHILFTPVSLGGQPEPCGMGLAPMAVAPSHQNQGIGSALVREGLIACREIGCEFIVVLGHPAYYPRFGFKPSVAFDIRSEYDVPDDVFMVLELVPGSLESRQGQISYHPAFQEL